MSSPLVVPRLIVAGPASGVGKTTVATGLMAAFAARGLAVSPHKVGPDYIDPGYHALATGRPGRNLDPYLCGEDRVVPLFLHGARDAQVAVVEGVMGLYDGVVGGGEFASTAHVARLLDAPVLLVVDAAAQGRSIAALASGFARYDSRVRLAGVVLNRVGSARHAGMLCDALAEVDLPVVGVLHRDDAVATPSRHLGLVPAAERSAEALATVAALGRRVADAVDLDAVLALAASAAPLHAAAWDPEAAVGGPVQNAPRVAVAAGAAFTFSYAETAELLAAAGADVVGFDPLRDETLPAGTRGVVLGGGFPEVHAGALAANAPLRADLAAFDGAVAAECAGLLYLAHELDEHNMCGVLPVRAAMTPRLTLGYRRAVAVRDSVLATAGTVVHGHEFHRTAVAPAGRSGGGSSGNAAWEWAAPTGVVREGWADARVHASYLHVHWAGHPQLARRFVTACR